MQQLSRVAGGLAAAATLAGAIAFGIAVVASQGVGYAGYVSEAGAEGQPHLAGYRWGIGVIAFGLALLAVAVFTSPAAPRRSVPAELLLGSAVLAALAGSVSCSRGCPLPPYETPTAADLVHGGASVLGVGLTALAILLLALAGEPSPLRRLSRWILLLVVPLGGVVAFALVFLGRGWTIGITERALLAVILLWTAVAGVVLSRKRPSTR